MLIHIKIENMKPIEPTHAYKEKHRHDACVQFSCPPRYGWRLATKLPPGRIPLKMYPRTNLLDEGKANRIATKLSLRGPHGTFAAMMSRSRDLRAMRSAAFDNSTMGSTSNSNLPRFEQKYTCFLERARSEQIKNRNSSNQIISKFHRTRISSKIQQNEAEQR